MRSLFGIQISALLADAIRCEKCGGRTSVPPAKGGRVPETVATSKLGEFCDCVGGPAYTEVGRVGIHTIDTAPDCPACGGSGRAA